MEEIEGKQSKETLTNKLRENPWILSTLVLGILTLIFILSSFVGMTGGAIGGDEAGQKLLQFYELNGAQGLEVVSVEDISGVYKVNFEYEGGVVPVYMTKDGKYAGSLSSISATQDISETQTDVPKSDKPKVELFVMTHCPYGTQSEKGLIPAIKTLGDTIDAKIRFVHYFMHEPEEAETSKQVCIREEQGEKFYDYLECFLEDGDSDRCLIEAKVDKSKMNECISSGRADVYYVEDSELSQTYEVRGSPTLVINNAQANSGRDSASYLSTICGAFNSEPSSLCSKELSSASPSPGFGYSASGSASTASCG